MVVVLLCAPRQLTAEMASVLQQESLLLYHVAGLVTRCHVLQYYYGMLSHGTDYGVSNRLYWTCTTKSLASLAILPEVGSSDVAQGGILGS